ncbi:unnamed protein product [Spirodela intermedia]|uniref:Uncharacterized protein n=1 Tax=Spirodela intermedia TaxID=51605 RepID=A0A7I8IR54_SPIIN|nr:unnamed protein product [Spirodela intermedia]CAA6660026.1 unnamed protein product [Spirodela intermedia]
MVPAGNPHRRYCDGYGGGYYDVHTGGSRGWQVLSEIVEGCHGREDHSKSNSGSAGDEEPTGGEGEERGEVGTCSKGKEQDEEWLRLSIGWSSSGGGAMVLLSGEAQVGSSPGRPRQSKQDGEKLELDLFRGRTQENRHLYQPSLSMAAPPRTPLFPPHPVSGLATYPAYPPDLTWGPFWNAQTATSTAPPPPQSHPYNARQFAPGVSGSTVRGQTSASPSGMRVVSPPSRTHAGVWFLLQASQTQAREPFLPQIPKCYLRIKDGRMTVRLLMKYLVNKLSLDDESEVEVRCRGQQLHPLLTVQHVRDSIWCTRDAVQLLPDSPGNHVMTLLYGRSP